MQITMDINPADLSLGILQILDKLSEDDKKKIASDVVKEWLSVRHEEEKDVFKQNIIVQLMASERKKEEDIVGTYTYNERMKKFKSSRDKMIEHIFAEGEKYFKQVIKKEIEDSEHYEVVFKECLKLIKENFPTYVQHAIQSWFINNLAQWSHEIYRASVDLPNIDASVSNIKQKLNEMGGSFDGFR